MITGYLEPFEVIWNNRALLKKFIKVDLHQMYAGSLLGKWWAFLNPLLLLLMYVVTYGFVMRVQPPQMSLIQYILHIFSGVLVFLLFSQALSAGTTSLVTHKDALLTRIFPSQLVPLRYVLVNTYSFGVGFLGVMLFSCLITGYSHALWFIPILLLFLMMAIMGIVWLTSLCYLAFSDIQQIITYFLMLMMVMSPIAYVKNQMPGSAKILFLLNPLSYFISSIQSIVVFHQLPTLKIFLGCMFGSLSLFYFGYFTFLNAKRFMYNYV